ncbi:hypothetical protein A3C57_01015 [Candidatus Nomurabacteria bacterium RIFCSPHIGHO2_02_FULL_33_12]|uniref:NlpC/P60 domain-containing protein n=1 Tax=Candidatus Nomurabacteria bacterium RIFCSPLOWO2_01_FULL_33_17 TaxID=1801764 RepID=A0A1F6WQN1_9BACT|nr:MAG: hypothetical protein A3C57_01015 [Candidatus Nomurabacteria bacterium RIFCSPHIGHO2_02_FULL_33_12]OGI84199.1 MAG: hypothetical protein A2903_00615 [Candidatus Nomurabacteria bacterium RIFCSPLOWO2_01_FULL_33_17]
MEAIKLNILLSEKKELIKIGTSLVKQKYGNIYDCSSFVRGIYQQVGLNSDFNNQPILSLEDIFKEENIGYLCFLKNKKYIQNLYRFSHIGIIFPEQNLLHYTRYFGEPNVREVHLTPILKILEVYNFVT